MSTIVAVSKNGAAVLAWDLLWTVGSTRSVNIAQRPKVRRIGKALVGTCGLSVYYNLFEHYLQSNEPGSLTDESSIFDFFLKFWRALRSDYHMVNQIDDDSPSPFADLDSEFIIANENGIFVVKEILSVGRFERSCVIGSGAAHAEGALSVLYGQHENAKEIAEAAVRVASEFDCHTGSEIDSLEVPMH